MIYQLNVCWDLTFKRVTIKDLFEILGKFNGNKYLSVDILWYSWISLGSDPTKSALNLPASWRALGDVELLLF